MDKYDLDDYLRFIESSIKMVEETLNDNIDDEQLDMKQEEQEEEEENVGLKNENVEHNKKLYSCDRKDDDDFNRNKKVEDFCIKDISATTIKSNDFEIVFDKIFNISPIDVNRFIICDGELSVELFLNTSRFNTIERVYKAFKNKTVGVIDIKIGSEDSKMERRLFGRIKLISEFNFEKGSKDEWKYLVYFDIIKDSFLE